MRVALIVMITVAGFLFATEAPGENSGAGSRSLVGQKLNLIRQLLESSRIQGLAENGPAGVINDIAIVRELVERAAASHAAADTAGAEVLLDRALQVLSGVTRVPPAHDPTPSSAAQTQLYDGLMAGLHTLRVNIETGVLATGNDGVLARAAARLAESEARADRLYSEGRIDEAIQLLQEAYRIAVITASDIHDRRTVTYTLHFTTPADEYAYERTRFQSYETFVRLKLSENKHLARSGKTVHALMAGADILRNQSENRASLGDHDAAIEAINQASKQLVRALRLLGLPIPE